ncbi:MAG: hypothetical protein GX316_02075 [Firmicutes bacterium]|nr:hypothetical protein [Bacillota bacterium]
MAYLDIHLQDIYHNTKTIADYCRKENVDVIGVTKGVCGLPGAARAMLAGGVVGLADSRLANLVKLRKSGIGTKLMLLRSPIFGEMAEAVMVADLILCSDLTYLKALARSVGKQKTVGIIPVVEMGDRREGVMPDSLEALFCGIRSLPEVKVKGLAINMACFAGVSPTSEHIIRLEEMLMNYFENNRSLVLSAGNSSCLQLIIQKKWPGLSIPAHLRFGESILLGKDVLTNEPIAGTSQDAFRLFGEVIEMNYKPSLPTGTVLKNAFDDKLVFKDFGTHLRAIVALGRQDLGAGRLYPKHAGIEVLGMTSDHTVLAVDPAEISVKPGDLLEFRLDYGGLLGVTTSPYVEKRILG